jgi:hypothetical protein
MTIPATAPGAIPVDDGIGVLLEAAVGPFGLTGGISLAGLARGVEDPTLGEFDGGSTSPVGEATAGVGPEGEL